MITSIQIRENVKNQLDRIKESNRQTYEEVIINLLKMAEIQKRKQEDLLIEQCRAMAEDDLKMIKEWETTDATLDWEWK
jgi:F0F1-type ATP synthase membrane subunit b/b'